MKGGFTMLSQLYINCICTWKSNHESIVFAGEGISLRPLPLLSLLPVNLNDYYRYEGSLTHPPCSENVIWTVFTDYIFVSHNQVGN
jgi:carbonic anhydrase